MARELYGPLFSAKESAKYLGIGRNRVYEMINADELPHIRDKNGSLIAKSVLDDYIEKLYEKEKRHCANST
ncbi:helix-turn-helix domain-containing protein [Thomasclavelia cocleata]|uniref:helix-turn-helix domain-containing protein n=1 Tax=Thomasclavelia cocleata TaxID=69824 RepID=UPI00257026E6|nr:helix-turn-helix domain-containing protein [Thomasclavelia cocleata]